MKFDVIIVVGRRCGSKQPMRIVFTEDGLRKLKARSPGFHEGLQNIENDLAKDLFPSGGTLLCTEICFEADDPDLADCEAEDLAAEFLSRLRFTADIRNENTTARTAVTA